MLEPETIKRNIHPDGYIRVRIPDHHRACKKGGYIWEHIVIAENKIGRKLLKGE